MDLLFKCIIFTLMIRLAATVVNLSEIKTCGKDPTNLLDQSLWDMIKKKTEYSSRAISLNYYKKMKD